MKTFVVQFVVSFLITGDSIVIRQLMEVKGMLRVVRNSILHLEVNNAYNKWRWLMWTDAQLESVGLV